MVLANIQKWDTDAKKMAHILLMLDKAAYLVYDALSDNEKKDAKKVLKKGVGDCLCSVCC